LKKIEGDQMIGSQFLKQNNIELYINNSADWYFYKELLIPDLCLALYFKWGSEIITRIECILK
jgi:hypothetical protein